MYKIDFKKPLSVYFIGIGGISMSGLAQILHFQNFTVAGSDEKKSTTTEYLEKLDININYSHKEQNITSDIDLVVFSAAVSPTNPEYVATLEKHIPILSRAQLLGQIMDNYSYSFSIAGTHGKTTTTSMVSEVLINANLDPTITVGGMLDVINGNIRVGKSEYFVTEACEYCNSFFSFNSKVAIILNIEEDHLDFFKDIDDIRSSFKQFASQVPDNGTIIINSDINNIEYIVEGSKSRIITFGTIKGLSTFWATNITFNEKAQASYDLYISDEFVDKIRLSANGLHNVYNSLAMIAAAYVANVPLTVIKQSLLSFKNAHRRFEIKGVLRNKNVTVIDDYAHHPTEVKTTLNTARLSTSKHIWCVFQPHTYTRTRLLLNDFADALSIADTVILCDIYASREKFSDDIHSRDLQNLLIQAGHNTVYFNSFSQIKEYILSNISEGDVLITMGAGDVYKIGDDLLKENL